MELALKIVLAFVALLGIVLIGLILYNAAHPEKTAEEDTTE